jgi:hypothetical protein
MKEKVLNTSDKQHVSETYYSGQFLNITAEYDPNGEGSFVGLECFLLGMMCAIGLFIKRRERLG